MKGLIYKYTSKTTGKCYIGQVLEYRLELRKNRHKYDKRDIHFYRARDKYGYDDFDFEIVEKDIEQEKLNEREIYWISFYDSFNNGYNSTNGGDGGNTYAKRSEEQMAETKAKISKANKGCLNGQSKNVELYNVITKKRETFETLTEAAEHLGQNRKTIYRLINDNHITKKGWCLYREGVTTIESVAEYKKLVFSE